VLRRALWDRAAPAGSIRAVVHLHDDDGSVRKPCDVDGEEGRVDAPPEESDRLGVERSRVDVVVPGVRDELAMKEKVGK